MQRIAFTSFASLILLTCVAGCSFLGLGKKKDETADMYSPAQDQGVVAPDPYSYPIEDATTMGGGGGRYHTVQKKETLCQISRQYYGSPSKWKDIYAANRSEIGDPNKIRVGQKLMIP